METIEISKGNLRWLRTFGRANTSANTLLKNALTIADAARRGQRINASASQPKKVGSRSRSRSQTYMWQRVAEMLLSAATLEDIMNEFGIGENAARSLINDVKVKLKSDRLVVNRIRESGVSLYGLEEAKR